MSEKKYARNTESKNEMLILSIKQLVARRQKILSRDLSSL